MDKQMKNKRRSKFRKRRWKRRMIKSLLVATCVLIFFVTVGMTALLLERLFDFNVVDIIKDKWGTSVDVVIDAGHGDLDPGANIGTVYEKDITLDIALKTGELLKSAGYTVHLTREDDTFLDLGERAEIANKKQAKVFVSIHCNSSEDGSGQGIETFYTDQKSESDGILAEILQLNLIEYTGAEDRLAKTANYTVLVRTEMPAALIEVGFLTNKTERELLMTDEYQNKIANGIGSAIDAYFNESE